MYSNCIQLSVKEVKKMEMEELEGMVGYYRYMLRNGKIELFDKKLNGMNEQEFQKGLAELKAIKKLKELLEIKMIVLEKPEEEYNMYCPYVKECEKEGKSCRGGNCKEYLWGK